MTKQATTPRASAKCIANSDMAKGPDVPLWECPCRECTRLDWEALDDDRPSLAAFRREGFPEVYA